MVYFHKPCLEIWHLCRTKLVDIWRSLAVLDLKTCWDSSQTHHEELATKRRTEWSNAVVLKEPQGRRCVCETTEETHSCVLALSSIYLCANFHAAPQLTQRLEEHMWKRLAVSRKFVLPKNEWPSSRES